MNKVAAWRRREPFSSFPFDAFVEKNPWYRVYVIQVQLLSRISISDIFGYQCSVIVMFVTSVVDDWFRRRNPYRLSWRVQLPSRIVPIGSGRPMISQRLGDGDAVLT